MRKTLAALGLAGVLAATGCLSTADSSAGERTVHVPGTTPYLHVIENNVHGNLKLFRAYYQDGYVHGSVLPANAGVVTDLEHFTCVNPEIPNHPPCAISRSGNDVLLPGDPEDVGTLGQVPTGVNHNARIDFATSGTGKTLQWRTYEHQAHTQLELHFADGFELYVVLDHPTHLFDIQLSTQPTTPTATTHAIQTVGDTD